MRNYQELYDFAQQNDLIFDKDVWAFQGYPLIAHQLLDELLKFQSKILTLNQSDLRLEPAQTLLLNALEVSNCELERVKRKNNYFAVKDLEVLEQMQSAIKSLNSYFDSGKRNDFSALVNTVENLKASIEGPFFFRESTKPLRRFIAGLIILTGLAVMAGCIAFLPVGGIITGALLGLAIIGGGLKLWEHPANTVDPVKRESIDHFHKSIKALGEVTFWQNNKNPAQNLNDHNTVESEPLLKLS